MRTAVNPEVTPDNRPQKAVIPEKRNKRGDPCQESPGFLPEAPSRPRGSEGARQNQALSNLSEQRSEFKGTGRAGVRGSKSQKGGSCEPKGLPRGPGSNHSPSPVKAAQHAGPSSSQQPGTRVLRELPGHGGGTPQHWDLGHRATAHP